MSHNYKPLSTIQGHYLQRGPTLNVSGYVESLEKHYQKMDDRRKELFRQTFELKAEKKTIKR